MSIHERKVDHLDLAINGIAAYDNSTGLEHFRLKHDALPELNISDISTEVTIFDRTFGFPLFISSMTGGTNRLGQFNAQIAEVASEFNLPMGLGSQRVMLEDEKSLKSFKIARDVAQNIFIGANIGGQQLLEYDSSSIIRKLVDPVRADALIIHLNVLQEMMQPEGDRRFKGITSAISQVVKTVSIPVIVKETGAGISGDVVRRLYEIGVRAVDVAGSGGTSWAKVENLRVQNHNPKNIFNNWGIPTVQCLIEISKLGHKDLTIISSGGIKSSLDILKSLALGAKMGAMAQPIIKILSEDGQKGLHSYLDSLKNEITIGMLLLGVRQPNAINQSHIYIQ